MSDGEDDRTGSEQPERTPANEPTPEEMELRLLREQVRQLQLQQASTQAVTVHVQQPAVVPKIKTFTGLPPTNSQETTFAEWRQQISESLEEPSITDKTAFLKRSLKGAALRQANGLKTDNPRAIITHLTALFGDLKSAEEEYLELCQQKAQRNQPLADFALTLYTRMQDLGERASLSDAEVNRRLYYAFSRSCTNQLLTLELRNKFGVPGESAPAFKELYRYLRQIEDLEPTARKGFSPTSPEPRPQRATHVAAHDVRQQPTPATRRPKSRYCYRCGEEGHFFKNCENPPNPLLVAEREREKRKRENEWRRRKGLPTLPEN